MGIAATDEAISVVKEMIRDEGYGFYLLELPSGEWGALWSQGLTSEHGQSVAEGDYLLGCAYVGELPSTVKYISVNGDELFKPKLTGLIGETKRKYG